MFKTTDNKGHDEVAVNYSKFTNKELFLANIH